MLKIATVCSGIGSPEMALKNLKVPHENVFACEIDPNARKSFEAIYGGIPMLTDMTKERWDKHGQSGTISDKTDQYSDLFVGGIPCQAFSLAGKRLGELDPRGLLFFDFFRYVKNQQPKVFIIENVKGLLSDAGGKTFSNWLQLLGRSVNTQELMFKHPDSLEYNLHHTVLNSKNFGVPQNRERVFIVGIRKDLPNTFRFPVGFPLTIRLKDILEPIVDEKYYLSDKMVNAMVNCNPNFQGRFNPDEGNGISSALTARYHKMAPTDTFIKEGFINQDTQSSQVIGIDGISPTLTAGTHGYSQGYIKVKEATKQGFAVAEPGDSINLSNPNSETRRGRVVKQIANTLDTACNQAVIEPYCVAMRGRNPDNPSDRTTGANLQQTLEPNSQGITNTITSVQKDNLIVEPAILVNNGFESTGRIYDENGLSCTIKAIGDGGGAKTGWYQVVEPVQLGKSKQFAETSKQIGDETQVAFCVRATESNGVRIDKSRIRRLTPLECWRLQGFPDWAFYNAKQAGVSDTQLYKQAGNSITVNVMQAIINNLLPILR